MTVDISNIGDNLGSDKNVASPKYDNVVDSVKNKINESEERSAKIEAENNNQDNCDEFSENDKTDCSVQEVTPIDSPDYLDGSDPDYLDGSDKYENYDGEEEEQDFVKLIEVNELKNTDTQIDIEVKIPESYVSEKVNDELLDFSANGSVKGFRQGKTPMRVIKSRYLNEIYKNFTDKLIENVRNNVLKKKFKNIPTLQDFSVKDLVNEQGKDIKFVLECSLRKEIKLPDFKDVFLEVPILKIGEEDVDEVVKNFAKFARKFKNKVERPIKIEDRVEIDAICFLDEERFEAGDLISRKLIIGESDISEFNDKLLEKEEGNQITIDCILPKDYNKTELAGKNVKFEVTIKSIYEPEFPVIDDEFAKKYAFDDLIQMRSFFANDIKSKYLGSIDVMIKKNLLDIIEDKLDFEAPSELLEIEKNSIKEYYKIAENPIEGEEEESNLEKLANRRVKIGMMIPEYARANHVHLRNTDVNNVFMEHVKEMSAKEAKEFNKKIELRDKESEIIIENMKKVALERKVIDHILKNKVTIVEKECTKSEISEWLKKEEDKITSLFEEKK